MTTLKSHVIYLNDLKPIPNPSNPNDPDNKLYRYKLLAEGDSWFTVGGLPIDNVLKNLTFDKQNIILSLAKPGDTLKKMTDICNNPTWQKMTSKKFGYDWNGLLISAGGNDLIEYLPELLLSATERASKTIGGPEDYLHLGNVQVMIDHIIEGYQTLVAWRDRPDSRCKNIPLIAHAYDYATPINVKAKFLFIEKGPWFYREFTKVGIPDADFIAVADYLMDRLVNALLKLHLPEVHIVKTSGLLNRAVLGAKVESNDWLNEIHPNHGGYIKIAQPISQKIKDVVRI